MGLLDRVVMGESFSLLLSEELKVNTLKNRGILETASLVFSEIVAKWGLKRAALLSLGGKKAYTPVEVAGFDVTTKRRLIIDRTQLDQWNISKTPLLLSESESYESYLSLREASLTERVIILPFYYQKDAPFALLFISLGEDESSILLDNCCPFLDDELFMKDIYRSLNPGSPQNSNIISPQSSDEIKKAILTEEDNRILLTFPLTPLLEKTAELDSLNDPFKRKKELLILFSSFYNERVSLYLDEKDNILISQPIELFPGEKLMQHQICLSLQQLFGEIIPKDLITLRVLKKAKEIDEVESFQAE